MQIDTAAAIDLSKEKKQNKSSFSDQMKAYIKHPGSGVLALLTLLGAVLTFALLFFLIGYILVKGVPYLSIDLFSLTYNSENLSLLPSLINTFILTVVSLVIAAPLGIFAAIYLVEYAKKGSKLVNVIRITAETLSGIPSIVYGLFGMLFFVTALHWGLSLLSGSLTLVIMILPLIMRTAEEALKSVPDSYREASFGLGAGKLRTIFTIVLPSAVPGILAGVILAISFIEIFLIIRASFLSRVKEVGVYRAIGVKKNDIYKMFIGEILAITTMASLPGFALMAYILHRISAISYFSKMFLINPTVLGLSLVLIYGFNLVFGLLPVFRTIRKTPAAILSRTDVN